jgi:hypothetical protein
VKSDLELALDSVKHNLHAVDYEKLRKAIDEHLEKEAKKDAFIQAFFDSEEAPKDIAKV